MSDFSVRSAFGSLIPCKSGDPGFRKFPKQLISVLGLVMLVAVITASAANSTFAATINVPADFATIQAAVTAASSGDTIIVAAGTYNENVTITKSLTLQGAQAGVDARGRVASETIVTPAVSSTAQFTISFNGLIIIDGFSFVGGTAGTQGCIYTTVGPNDGMQVLNNRFSAYSTQAIWFNRGGQNMTIDKNVMDGTNIAGGSQVMFFNGPQNFAGLFITNNWVINNPARAGVFVDGTNNVSESAVRDPLISGNLFDSNSVGLNLGSRSFGKLGTPATGTYAGEISNNTFSNNAFDGVQGGIQHVLVTGNAFINNGRSGLALTSFSNTTDPIRGAQFSTVESNVMSGNGYTQPNGAGISFGVQFAGTIVTNQARFNRIVGNNIGAFYGGSESPINAENNWWGCNTGPGGAASGGCAASPNGKGGAGAANLDASPWLVLTTSAATPTVFVGGTDLVTSLLTTNSDNLTPAGGSVPNTTQASFVGTFGTVLPNPNTFTSGSTSTTFTGTAQGVGGVATTVDGQTVSAPITVYNAACVGVSIPTNITTLRNVSVTVPVNVDLLTGRNVLGYTTTITYDSTKLTYTGNDKTGTLSSGFTVIEDTSTLNTIKLFAFGAVAPSGSGTLLKLLFTASPGPISATPTPVSFSDFSFNEGNPCSTTSNGSVKIISGDITGRVTYALNGSNGVPNASMFADGTPDDVTTNTDYTIGTPATWGNYTLTGLGPGDYVVTPSKAPQALGNTNGISPFDASCIAQWGVGQTCSAGSVPAPGTPLFRAADVTKNGTLSPLDAAYIAQFSVGISNPSFTGTWEFIAPSTNYAAAQVETGMSGQNYTAILLGDVTGNWNPALLGGARPALADDLLSESRDAVTATVPGITALHEDLFESRDAITATAPDIKAVAGSSVIVPIDIQGLKGKGVTAYQFDLIYDPKVMEPQKVAADIAGTISDGMNVVFNSAEPGLLKVAVYGIAPVNGQGVLVNLRFSAVGEVGSSTELRLGGLMLNEGGFKVHLAAGQLTIAAASQGTIRGRVLTALGIGIAGARVTVTSTTGETHTVVSGAFGYYEFGGLQLSETYTITVSHKRYSFVPQSVVIADALTNQDMIAKQ